MKKTTPHYIFLTPGFPESEKDSTTIPALQVYLKSVRQSLPEINITVISFQFPFSNEAYNWNGMQVIPLNGRNQRLKKFWVWNKARKTLEKIHQKYPITILHSFWIGECSFIGQKISIKYDIPHVVTVMGQDAISRNNLYVKKLRNSKAKIVTLSKNHSNILLKNRNLNSVIIPWGLDTSIFPKLQQNKINILGVGSLNAVKNYTAFITIIAQLAKKYPNLKVEIIGNGKKQKELSILISKLQLDHIISLTGILPRKKVLQKMSQSKILLHTSTYESYGYIFAEALYSGMHIVSHLVGIAEKNKHWNICKSSEDMILACDILLSNLDQEKKRTLIYPSEETLESYLKLYNA